MDVNYAEYYEKLHRNHWWWQARAKLVGQWLDALDLPENGKVLDIGCGGDWAFDRWSRYGDVWGVEKSPAIVQAARARSQQIYYGPFDRNYKPAHRFTLILMLDVLEHIEEPHAAIEYASELLEANGRILITVPAMPSLWTSHDDLNHHFVRYTKSRLESVITASAIQIDYLQYFFHWTTAAKLLVRLKESMIATQPRNPSIPGPKLNHLLYRITLLEQKLLGRINLPFGTSLVCIGSKTNASTASRPAASLITPN